MLEHPVISRINATGYANMVNQPEHAGIDYFGNEIVEGDQIVEYDGEVVLKENLESFLVTLGFKFKIAE